MLRTQIYLPEDLMIHLRYLADTEEVSLSETIRQHLVHSLKSQPRKLTLLAGFVGRGQAGRRISGLKEIARYYRSPNT